MKYIVLELQTSGDNVSTIINQYDTLHQAESAYHQILTYAAISEVEYHGAILMNSQGSVYKNECYYHEPITN